MNKPARIGLSLLIVAAAAAAAHRTVAVQYRCNAVLKRVEERTLATGGADAFRSSLLTRLNLDELERCRADAPWDVQFPMFMAGNYWVRGDLEAARETYRQSLQVDRRPEIYRNLGLIELELNDPRARNDLETACILSPNLIWEIPEPQRSEIDAKIKALQRAPKR